MISDEFVLIYGFSHVGFFLIKRFHGCVFCILHNLIQMVMVYIIILGTALIVDILFILVYNHCSFSDKGFNHC